MYFMGNKYLYDIKALDITVSIQQHFLYIPNAQVQK